ncbi:MAG: septum formation initiator family protein [Pseudomonadales bacterium]
MIDKLFSLALLTILVLLQRNLWVGEGSLAHVHTLRGDIEKQQQRVAEHRARNDRLEREIYSLKNDPSAIEQRARQELGMIKQGETFYLFVDEPEL